MTRNIGIKVPVPKDEADDGDQKNPFNGTLSVRGKLFHGKVVKAKAKDTVVLEKVLPKYKKFVQLEPSPPHSPHSSSTASPPHSPLQSVSTVQLPSQS